MKLIDILVRDLHKFGGWPEGAVECVRFVDEATIDFYDEHGNWPDDCSLTYGPIAKEICITPIEPCQRESVKLSEYETALAASKPEWDGEGLPPVGCKCEWQDKNTKAWIPVVIAYSSEWVTVVRELRPLKVGDAVECCINNFGEEERLRFRPIRSEADKKRDEAVRAMISHKDDPIPDTENYYHAIYDAIAAGKIPHIRID